VTPEHALLHVLPSGSAREVVVDAQILGVDLDLDVVGHLGHDVDAGEAGLALARRVEGRHPDQPVRPGLGLEVPVGVDAREDRLEALEPRLVARIFFEPLDLEHRSACNRSMF
jgi:hypothetical protein